MSIPFQVPTMSTVETNDSSIGTAAGSRTTDHHWRHRHGWEWCLGEKRFKWNHGETLLSRLQNVTELLKFDALEKMVDRLFSNMMMSNLRGVAVEKKAEPCCRDQCSAWCSLYNFYSWGRLTDKTHHVLVAKLIVAEISEFWHPMFFSTDGMIECFILMQVAGVLHAVGFDIAFSLVWQGTWCVFFSVSRFKRLYNQSHWKIVMESLRSGHKTTCTEELQSRYFPEPHIPNVRLEPVSAETRKMRAVGVMKSLKHLVNNVNALTGTQYRNSNGHMESGRKERPCNTACG